MVNAASSKANVGEILLNQGRLEDAAVELRHALRIFRASGARPWATFAGSLLGAVEARSFRFEEARAILEDVVVECRLIGEPQQIAAAEAFLAELLLLQGDAEGAAVAAKRLLAENQDEALAPMLLRLQAYHPARTGELDAAVRLLDQSLQAARDNGAEHEVAFTLEVFLRSGLLGERDGEDLRRDRDSLFERLGIVSVPQVPSLAMDPLEGSPAGGDPPGSA